MRMTDDSPLTGTTLTGTTLIGLGAMGTALARAWSTAGHKLTVFNRTAARAAPLVAAGASPTATAAEAVAASRLIVLCLLDDAAVAECLADVDLMGRDLVNLTTSTPEQARARAAWARRKGARYVAGGIMAVPPMIGVAESGGYVLYSGSQAAFEAHRHVLSVPAAGRFVGPDDGAAALHDVALLSAMYGMFAGVAHAFAITRHDIAPKALAPLLVEWLTAMASTVHETAERLHSGDYTTGVVSNLAMQVQGSATLLRTAEEQGVGSALLAPYLDLMRRRLAAGHGDEDNAGVIDLLSARR